MSLSSADNCLAKETKFSFISEFEFVFPNEPILLYQTAVAFDI